MFGYCLQHFNKDVNRGNPEYILLQISLKPKERSGLNLRRNRWFQMVNADACFSTNYSRILKFPQTKMTVRIFYLCRLFEKHTETADLCVQSAAERTAVSLCFSKRRRMIHIRSTETQFSNPHYFDSLTVSHFNNKTK